MKAVVKYEEGPQKIRYMEVDEPKVGHGDVKIKVAYAGICGTDLKIRHNEYWSNPPVILGHEFSGIVVEVGESVTVTKPGDRVTAETAQVICGHCEYCLSGNYLMCDKRLSIGYGTNGAFGQYIVVREQIIHKLPDSVELDEASLCEPAAVAFHSVFDYTNIRPHNTAIIMGPGSIGQLVAQMVRAAGARAILCGTTNDAFRLKIAQEIGFEVFNSQGNDLIEYINTITDGKGIDYAFDCTGVPSAINQALNCLKKKGLLVQVGLMAKPSAQIDFGIIPMRELTIVGAFGHINSNWNGVLKLMEQKKINVKPLITNRFALQEWEQAFDMAEELEGIKVLLQP